MIPFIISFVIKNWRVFAVLALVISIYFAGKHIYANIYEHGVADTVAASKDATLNRVEKLEETRHETENMSDIDVDADLARLGIMRRAEDR